MSLLAGYVFVDFTVGFIVILWLLMGFKDMKTRLVSMIYMYCHVVEGKKNS